ELQEVEIGVGNHHIFRLAADPTAHVDVAICRAGTGRIHVQTDSGPPFLTIPAAAAGNVERNRNQIADFDEFDVASGLDDFAGDLMAENQTLRRSRTPPDHVLIAPADVG